MRLYHLTLPLLACAVPAHAAVTADSYSLVASVFTPVTGSQGDTDDGQGASGSTLPSAPLSVLASNSAASANGSASATAAASTTFAGSAAAEVFLGPFDTSATFAAGGSGSAYALAASSLSYFFRVDRLSLLTLDYRASVTSPTTDYSYEIRNLGSQGDPLAFVNGLTGTGSASVQLVAGRYLLQLQGRTTSFADSAGTQSSTSRGARFEVAVSEAPEPASWMTLIAGFGLVGAAARRRRGRTIA